MEELRSTQALDNEIIADAKKKAERILEKADETCASLLSGVEGRVSEALKQAGETQDAMLETFRKNTVASLPLEKERYLVSFADSAVLDAVNAYFRNAGEAKRLSLVEAMLVRAKPVLEGKKVSAYVRGFSLDEAGKMLESSLGVQLEDVRQDSQALTEDALPGFEFDEGVILVSDDGSLKCRLTLGEKVREILDGRKMELAQALFSGRLSV